MPRSNLSLLIVLSLWSFSIFATDANAKPRWVDLEEELNLSTIVTPAKIVSYDSNLLKFHALTSTAILSAKYSTDPTWNPNRFIRTEWPPKDVTTNLTAEWPPVGAEVLIVVDKEGVISLFAWPYGDNYRFWSPIMTGSLAIFNCEPFGTPLAVVNNDHPGSSWDGCLVQKSKITASSWAPLHRAVHGLDGDALTTIKMLLDRGVDIEVKDSYGRTSLQRAFDYDKLDIAELLIKNGADIEAKNGEGNTVLHQAASLRKSDAIKLLVKMKADLNAKNENGDTALELALNKNEYGEKNIVELLKPLIINGADIETRNWQHWTPFQRVITYGWFDAAKLLLDNGADINAKDEHNRTILNFIVMQYHSKTNDKTDAIEFLLKYGADPNIGDEEGIMPLHHAALKSNTDIARMLLKNGANPLAKDKKGDTPIDKAKSIGNTAMVELLTSE